MSHGAPSRLHRRRYDILGHCRFLTFSCRHQLPLFTNDAIKRAFTARLAKVRSTHAVSIVAWVIMPEHVHLLLHPDVSEAPMSRVLSALKRPFAEEVLHRWRSLDAPILHRITDTKGHARFWERGGGYDRNVTTSTELVEKINYIHFNPVRRGLVETPADWAWSSARWYAGLTEGPVKIDRVWGI